MIPNVPNPLGGLKAPSFVEPEAAPGTRTERYDWVGGAVDVIAGATSATRTPSTQRPTASPPPKGSKAVDIGAVSVSTEEVVADEGSPDIGHARIEGEDPGEPIQIPSIMVAQQASSKFKRSLKKQSTQGLNVNKLNKQAFSDEIMQELKTIDANGDGTLSYEEIAVYVQEKLDTQHAEARMRARNNILKQVGCCPLALDVRSARLLRVFFPCQPLISLPTTRTCPAPLRWSVARAC